MEAKGNNTYTITLIGVVVNILAFTTPLTIPHAFTQNTPPYTVILLFSNLSLSSIIFTSIPKPHDNAEEVKSKQQTLTIAGAIFLITMLMALLAYHGGNLSAPLCILDAVGSTATAASYAAALTYTHELTSRSITN
jgi:hypothetical protein